MGRPQLLRLFVLIAVALVLVGGGLTYFLSREMNRTADAFFIAVSRQEFPQARELMTETLRTSTDELWLKKLLAAGQLLDPTETRWTERKSAHGFGELTGSIIRESGVAVPVTMLFARENLAWKLYAIRRPFTGALPQAMAPLLPDKEEQVTLIKRALRDFTASVQSRNMSYFRSTLAPSRRELYTTEKLDEAFRGFFDIEEDLTSLESIDPKVDELQRSEAGGEVTLSGHFATLPKQVRFSQRYAYEQTDWRLLSFKIDMQ